MYHWYIKYKVLLIDRRSSHDTHVLVLLSHHQVYMRTLRYGIHTDSKRFLPVHNFFNALSMLKPRSHRANSAGAVKKDVGPLSWNTVYAWSPLTVPPTDPKVLRCTKYGSEEGAIFRPGNVNHCSYSAQSKFGIARCKFLDSWVR